MRTIAVFIATLLLLLTFTVSAHAVFYTFSNHNKGDGSSLGVSSLLNFHQDNKLTEPTKAIKKTVGAPNPVPASGALVFFGSGILGLLGIRRRFNSP
jgi:hypothetical protein